MSIRVPKYRLHKASGQALVELNGRRIYLGKHGSEESEERYRRLIAEWLESGQHRVPSLEAPPSPDGLTVNEVLLAYWRFAETYYVNDGEPTKELACMREALRPLRQLYGHEPAAKFGPKSLKAVRQHMISQGLSRKLINRRVGRIKRMFKWAVAEELVPAAVFHGLQTVAGLRYGRTEARETEPIKPVADEHVDAILPFVSPQVAAMIRLQRLTGMRPGEVVQLRACDIDTSGDVWLFEPADHKNRWRGHRKLIPLGPKGQEIMKPFLDRDPSKFLFSPAEAEAWRLEHRPPYAGRERKTKIFPCETKRRERTKRQRKRRTSKRPKRDRYDTCSYRQAITYGLERARREGVEIPGWSPNQLRHARATEVRKQHGLEAAQVLLGHARADVTQVYAKRDLELAVQIAKETG